MYFCVSVLYLYTVSVNQALCIMLVAATGPLLLILFKSSSSLSSSSNLIRRPLTVAQQRRIQDVVVVRPHLALRGAGVPLSSLISFLVHSLPHVLLLFTFSHFPFLICFTYFLLFSIQSSSARIVPLRFQSGSRRRRPNLGLACSVHFMLSVLLSWDLLWCFVVFGLV